MPTPLVKHQNGSHRCPSECSIIHSVCDRVVSFFIIPVLSPLGLSALAASTSPETIRHSIKHIYQQQPRTRMLAGYSTNDSSCQWRDHNCSQQNSIMASAVRNRKQQQQQQFERNIICKLTSPTASKVYFKIVSKLHGVWVTPDSSHDDGLYTAPTPLLIPSAIKSVRAVTGWSLVLTLSGSGTKGYTDGTICLS